MAVQQSQESSHWHIKRTFFCEMLNHECECQKVHDRNTLWELATNRCIHWNGDSRKSDNVQQSQLMFETHVAPYDLDIVCASCFADGVADGIPSCCHTGCGRGALCGHCLQPAHSGLQNTEVYLTYTLYGFSSITVPGSHVASNTKSARSGTVVLYQLGTTACQAAVIPWVLCRLWFYSLSTVQATVLFFEHCAD